MTRRSSTRAQAQEFYRQMVGDEGARGSLSKGPPDPNPLPADLKRPKSETSDFGGERGPIVPGEGKCRSTKPTSPPGRALYEGSAVPVCEIAALVGVSERTHYKYFAKYGWKKRYARLPRGEAAARADSGRRWQATPGFAPAKGTGGRFVRREAAGAPFAAGLKALDPAAHARADAACLQAQQRARRAEADALAERWADENVRAIRAVRQAQQDLEAYDAAWRRKPVWSPEDRLRARAAHVAQGCARLDEHHHPGMGAGGAGVAFAHSVKRRARGREATGLRIATPRLTPLPSFHNRRISCA